jgi:hypothetical protein
VHAAFLEQLGLLQEPRRRNTHLGCVSLADHEIGEAEQPLYLSSFAATRELALDLKGLEDDVRDSRERQAEDKEEEKDDGRKKG